MAKIASCEDLNHPMMKFPARVRLMNDPVTDGIEMRRSRRVMVRLAIQVRWTPAGDSAITENTTTLVVNAHAALISLAMKVKPGARSFVRNRAVAEDKEWRGVLLQEQQEGKSGAGVDFLLPTAK